MGTRTVALVLDTDRFHNVMGLPSDVSVTGFELDDKNRLVVNILGLSQRFDGINDRAGQRSVVSMEFLDGLTSDPVAS